MEIANEYLMKRFDYLDVLKGIAIIAVVLYHIGYMQFGFLGGG